MKTNPLKQGTLIENSAGIGTVTRGVVRDRAVELAVVAEARHDQMLQAARVTLPEDEV